jgi:hypothetical protein
MKLVILHLLLFTSSPFLFGDEIKLWDDGRITPEQPFKAMVRGVIPGWGGDTVILQEIGGRERYCLAMLHVGLFRYEVQSKEEFDEKKIGGATFISPSVEVERFSWSMGIAKIGRIFGDEDFVAKWYSRSKPKSEQAGADQPATASESKSKGKDEPQPESKVAPR